MSAVPEMSAAPEESGRTEGVGGTEGTGRPAAKAGPPAIELPRSRLLLVGSGAFGVTALPSWAVLMRMWYGWDVRACLTYAAAQLVAPQALAAATQAPVEGPDWDTARGIVPHQELAEWPDLVIVAPATANFVAKCALGMPDSLALSTVLATRAPVVLAPSIPAGALERPAVRRNLRTLAEDGFHVTPMQPGLSAHKAKVGVASGMPDIQTTLRFAASVLRPDAAPQEAGADRSAPAGAPTGALVGAARA
ncbi:flavoprotein [Kitasatospora sp. NPDC096077]|uniref:flavoprotein n=1 Tax=Kitasatospora sp. NPDC096077 TaxID=3155544 RepID=UPI003332F477